MTDHFELFVLNNNLSAENWQKLYSSLVSYLGMFGRFEITFRCQDNVVRYFISANKDLGSLSNGIEGILLRPVDVSEIEPPDAVSKESFLQFVTGGNLLDLKEKTAVNRAKELEYAMFSVRIFNVEKAYVRGVLFFKNAAGEWSRASKSATFFPAKLLAIDFSTNTRYLKRTIPKYLDIEKSLHMMTSQDNDALFEVDTFPYFAHNYYLSLTDY
jgi:hypothetical protein